MPAGVAIGLFGLVVPLVDPEDPGFVTVGSGPVVPPAVPDGVLPVVGPPIVPVVPVGVPELSGVVEVPPDVVEPLPIELDDDGDDDEEVASPPVDEGDVDGDVVVEVLPVDDVVDGFDIELSVFGASVLLQAPKAATVAAMATHLIERSMFGS